ncbi:stress protein [Pyxidicoccus fallax]|uniref:Stress protein n=1 Tax=Pyxidicoccus fallax TaxID=394095 RepID=A0A848L5V0_9BACT|nr:stress protein [Pyxidicoccus fallax]NMO13652.1 stress protein [Pyxidicoccus fallax]NPC76860.1 stress protein [Pyxidicoccus fallax]
MIRTKLIASITTALAISLFTALPAHALNPAAAGAAEAVSLDPVSIGQAIAKSVHAVPNREGFVKGLLYSARHQTGGKYNVVVANLGNKHEASGLRNVVYYQTFNYGDLVYGVWAFEDGVFDNQGDGGFINWTFDGLWERQDPNGQSNPRGMRVVFRKKP